MEDLLRWPHNNPNTTIEFVPFTKKKIKAYQIENQELGLFYSFLVKNYPVKMLSVSLCCLSRGRGNVVEFRRCTGRMAIESIVGQCDQDHYLEQHWSRSSVDPQKIHYGYRHQCRRYSGSGSMRYDLRK